MKDLIERIGAKKVALIGAFIAIVIIGIIVIILSGKDNSAESSGTQGKESEVFQSEDIEQSTDIKSTEEIIEEVTEEVSKNELNSTEIIEEPSKDKTPTENDKTNKNDSSAESNKTPTSLSNTDKKLKEIVDGMITSSMSDFEKAIKIHDWIVFNVDYDQSLSNFSVEALLNTRYAVCDAYAEAFKRMGNFAGLDVICVTGTADGQSHKWNQVKINGVWYNVDTTWDDPTWNDILEGKKQFDDHSCNSYEYFLISDQAINKDHIAKSSKNTCSKNYNRREILKYGAEKSRHKKVVYVETKEQTHAAIEQYMKKELTNFKIWTIEAYGEKLVNEWLKSSKYSFYDWCRLLCSSDVECELMIIPMTEWNSYPVVTSREEFDIIYAELQNKEPGEYFVRYENETVEMDFSGIEVIGYNSSTYYDGKYRLIRVDIY